MDLAAQFLEARTAQGWSQRDLAAHSGVSRTALVRIEAGDRSVRLDTLDRVAAALGMTVEPDLHRFSAPLRSPSR